MTKLGTSFAILEYLIEALLRFENAKKKSVKITQNVHITKLFYMLMVVLSSIFSWARV